ncbi:MAG: BON domain-containing protein, partial [Bdellovibrionales bacterium]
MKTNAEVQKDVYDELKWDPRIHEGDIGVSVSNNVVTLSGNIPSYAEKWAAEEAAQKVSGVNAVVNDINVKTYGLQKHDDQDIAEAAAKAITWNVWVPKDKVKVIVDNGWVTLS